MSEGEQLPPDDVNVDADEDADPPLRPGQVLGLLEHQLGAVVLPEDDDSP